MENNTNTNTSSKSKFDVDNTIITTTTTTNKLNKKKPFNKSKKNRRPSSNNKSKDDGVAEIDIISSSITSTHTSDNLNEKPKFKDGNKHSNYPPRRKSSIEILSVKTNTTNSIEKPTAVVAKENSKPQEPNRDKETTKSKRSSFKDFKEKHRQNSNSESNGKSNEIYSKEPITEIVEVPFEHKQIPIDLFKNKKKPYEKKTFTKPKINNNNKNNNINKKQFNGTQSTNQQIEPPLPLSSENQKPIETEECNTTKKKFEKKRIPKELLSVMSVGSPKKEFSSNNEPILKTPNVKQPLQNGHVLKDRRSSSTSSSLTKNSISDETHIPLKYRSSIPSSSDSSSLAENNTSNSNPHGDSNGNQKHCPYLNRLTGNSAPNTTSPSKTDTIKDKVNEKEDEDKNKNDTKTETTTPFKSLLGNSGPTDFFNSLLNEKLLNEDHAWEPTPLIDISQINNAFEAPKLTENTSTIVMTNAEKEILNHRGESKHPDDHGGPYVVKLSNLQKGFNSDVLIDTILKPKKILFLRTKFFWEPNFKVSVDELKKVCFLELKYFEEIERCITLLKNNNYLIKVSHCTHDDFAKVANLQNMKWGDPEFIDLNNTLIYKLVRYKVNLNGEPIGLLKDGEDEAGNTMKLPSLPTLGNMNSSKKQTDTAESIYSKLSAQIITNKEKNRRDSINTSSASNSPSVNTSPLATTEPLATVLDEKTVSLSPATTPVSALETPTAIRTGNYYKPNHTPGNKFTGNKTYNKNKFNNNNKYKEGNNTNNNNNNNNNNGSNSRSTTNSPRFFDNPDNKSFGFASGFIKSTSSRH
ncbi:hypothetical protein ACO0SA_000440 [Hanseniaspora valbyensis]